MIVWIVFLLLILLILALDLGVFNKKAHVISTKEASIWTLIWVIQIDNPYSPKFWVPLHKQKL